MTRKISVTTGTRAEYGILRPLLHAIKESRKLELQLIVTGTHLSKKHGYTIDEIKKDGFKIAATLPMMPKGDTNYFMSKALGAAIVRFSDEFLRLRPDINVILGDRDEMLASAIAAYHMNIPNAHIHGGDRSGGLDEYNRHAITKISNIHFAASKKSMKRIIKMGEDSKHVFFTGSPSIDEVLSNKITNKADLEQKYGLKFTGREVLLLQHPITTESHKSEEQICKTLDAIVMIGNKTIAISPNSDSGSRKILRQLRSYSRKYKFIKTYTTLPRDDFLGMLKNCGVLVGNSSSGIIEASYFNIPVVGIGTRQKGRERGKNIIEVKRETTRDIYLSILSALRKTHVPVNHFRYGHGNASKKIVKILERIPLRKELIKKQITY